MKKHINLLTGAALITFQSFAFAEKFHITQTGVDLTQQTFFVGVSPDASSSPCARKNEFKWNLSDPGVKEIMSVALHAMANGRQVHIGVSQKCVTNQATGSHLFIR